jgi:hypothetical protein
MAIVAYDDFNRVSMSPGSTPSGQAWSVVSGAWDVNGTTLGETNGADGSIILLNAGRTDLLAECKFYGLGGMEAGELLVRANATGTTHYSLDVWTAGEIQIKKNVFTTLVQTASGVYQEGDTVSLKVIESGGSTVLTAYRNGTQVLTYTDTAAGRPTGTYVGYRHASGQANYFVRIGGLQIRDATDTPNSYPTVTPRVFSYSWDQAKNARAIRPARIAWVGDSILEGWGASSRTLRSSQRFLNFVRSEFSLTGGEGYVPAFYAHSQTWKYAFVKSGTVTDNNTYGLGKRAYSIAGVGGGTLTATGTHVDLFWRGGGGTFTYAVDGGATTTVNTAANVNDANMEGRRTRVSLGAAGSHTVAVNRTAGTVVFEGAVVYNGDTTSGFNLLDWTHSGFYSQDHGDHGFTTLAPHMRDFQPSLVVFELTGANNYIWNNTTPAANAANVQTLLNRYLGLASQPDVLLVIPRITAGPNSGTQTWNNYANLVAAITHPRVNLVDLRNNTAVTLADGVHPNDAGHLAMASAIHAALVVTPPAPSGWRLGNGTTLQLRLGSGTTLLPRVKVGPPAPIPDPPDFGEGPFGTGVFGQ